MIEKSIYYLIAQKIAFYLTKKETTKGAIDVQDDYNRFIRRSIEQAKRNYEPCNYEDIFTDSDADMKNSCGCMGIMEDTDTDTKNSCGCMEVMEDTDTGTKNSCGCKVQCKPTSEKCDKNVPVMAFVEMQPFGRMYNEAEGLCRGTLFPALDKPFTGRGGCR